jgi:UDP-glucose 4-epimerase
MQVAAFRVGVGVRDGHYAGTPSGMRVVVLGATGNVGTALLRALADEDRVTQVVGVARRLPTTAAPKTTWAQADIAHDDLEPLFAGADCVVHLAWLIQPSRNESITYATNVRGSARVFAAAGAAGVPALVYASSIGAYAPGPKDRFVDESWPTTGTRTSFYARHKAAVERELESFEASHPETRCVRLRPGLIFQRPAATGIRRLFAGPFLPSPLVRPDLIPVVPRHPRLRVQALHADDVADAYRRAIVTDGARGAFNVAADPVIDGDMLGRLLDARPVNVPGRLLRALATLSWRARLQPSEPGWLDMGLSVPLMDTSRARDELGWTPRHGADDALLELLDGMRAGAGHPTPPLDPATSGPLRVREIVTGVGRTSK